MAGQCFEAGRASIWAHEAAISADGWLLDTAHKDAIEAAQLIGRFRIETPEDAANAQRMRAGAR